MEQTAIFTPSRFKLAPQKVVWTKDMEDAFSLSVSFCDQKPILIWINMKPICALVLITKQKTFR